MSYSVPPKPNPIPFPDNDTLRRYRGDNRTFWGDKTLNGKLTRTVFFWIPMFFLVMAVGAVVGHTIEAITQ